MNKMKVTQNMNIPHVKKYCIFFHLPIINVIVLQCENMLDAEHMTWLVINHVTDLIQLSRESPVQDFIR